MVRGLLVVIRLSSYGCIMVFRCLCLFWVRVHSASPHFLIRNIQEPAFMLCGRHASRSGPSADHTGSGPARYHAPTGSPFGTGLGPTIPVTPASPLHRDRG